MLTLTNSFHNTTAQTRLTRAEMDHLEMLSGTSSGKLIPSDKALIRRIRTALCPSWRQGCTCSNFWGER